MGMFGDWSRGRQRAARDWGFGDDPPPITPAGRRLLTELEDGDPLPPVARRRRPEPPAFAEDPASRLRRLEALRRDELYLS